MATVNYPDSDQSFPIGNWQLAIRNSSEVGAIAPEVWESREKMAVCDRLSELWKTKMVAKNRTAGFCVSGNLVLSLTVFVQIKNLG